MVGLDFENSALAPDPRSMEWQQDGELALADLDALVHALQQVECDRNSAELQRLGQIDLPRGLKTSA